MEALRAFVRVRESSGDLLEMSASDSNSQADKYPNTSTKDSQAESLKQVADRSAQTLADNLKRNLKRKAERPPRTPDRSSHQS